MAYVSVSHSPNATGVVIYDSNGTNTFTYGNFSNNVFLFQHSSTFIDKQTYAGGGGFYVEFSYCGPGNTCESPTTERKADAEYTFLSCTFSQNFASNLDTIDHSTYIVPYGSDHEAFGRGGGLSLFLKGKAHNIVFKVLNCLFEGNRAIWGAGMFIELHDNVYGNTVSVSGSQFIKNFCPYTIYEGTAGGGMRIGLYVYWLDKPLANATIRNFIKVESSNFTGNSALAGGGLSISPSVQDTTEDNVAIVHLLVNKFEGNVAKLGSAMNVDRFGSILVGLIVIVWVESCTFKSNSIMYAQYIAQENHPYQLGLGAIHINEVPVRFNGSITLEDNDGSAVAAIGTFISFIDCNAVFRHNRGNKGAGVVLHGAGSVHINDGTSMLFEGNKAITEGGAIYQAYINREILKSASNCFLHHTNPFLRPEEWKAEFKFVDNHDHGGSHINAIHSTSLLPCSRPGGSGIANDTADIFCWNGWKYFDANNNFINCTDVITSDIGKLTFLHGSTTSTFSGWQFDMPIALVDDLNHTIEGQSFTVLYNDTQKRIVEAKETISVSGEPNTAKKITVESLGNRIWHFELIVELRPCPPGFVANLTNSGFVQCVCSELFGGAILCDDISKNVHLLNGMWMGKLDNLSEEYYVMECPLRFCEDKNRKFYEFSGVIDMNQMICGSTKRKGINCAECIDGYGPAVNSPNYECVSCNNISLRSNIAKYVASVYLPLAILFTVLIVFDIRLTNGPANAFILYCQIVSSTFDLNAGINLPHFDYGLNTYRFLFGIFNLEFIENYISPICFSPNFTILSIFIMDYAVALFPLFMIPVVIVFLKISERCCLKNQYLSVKKRRVFLSISRLASLLSSNKRKTINDAILPAFASFLLLSYTKLSITSSYILNSQNPINSSGVQVYPPRVYFAAQYTVNDIVFHYYRIPANIFMLIVTLLPLVFLDYPLRILERFITRVKCLRMIYPVDKVHLFMNMFQGCYRDKMRFFAGLYFVFRLVINVSYVATSSRLEQLLVQQAATTLMIAILALCQPYEKKFLNYVDILIFTNLAFLNSVSFYIHAFNSTDPSLNPPYSILVLQYVLVFIPLVYMVGYVIWNITGFYHARIKETCRLLTSKIKKKVLRRDDFVPLISDSDEDMTTCSQVTITRGSLSEGEIEFEDDMDVILSRAKEHNTYTPPRTLMAVSKKHREEEAASSLI